MLLAAERYGIAVKADRATPNPFNKKGRKEERKKGRKCIGS
jgi:hypothetical protein